MQRKQESKELKGLRALSAFSYLVDLAAIYCLTRHSTALHCHKEHLIAVSKLHSRVGDRSYLQMCTRDQLQPVSLYFHASWTKMAQKVYQGSVFA